MDLGSVVGGAINVIPNRLWQAVSDVARPPELCINWHAITTELFLLIMAATLCSQLVYHIRWGV